MDNGEAIAYQGMLGEIVHTKQPDGRIFERYRRPPGTRLVIMTPVGKLLMTKERRQETKGVDLRLPGGKVCDSLTEYYRLLADGADIAKAAQIAAAKEAREEVGLELRSLELLTKAVSGATVEWDLYYFLSCDYRAAAGQQLEAGEEIDIVELEPSEVRRAIAAGQMHEWRSVGVLLGLVLPKIASGECQSQYRS